MDAEEATIRGMHEREIATLIKELTDKEVCDAVDLFRRIVRSSKAARERAAKARALADRAMFEASHGK